MAVKQGDFVRIEYTGKLVSGEIFDTTSVDEAKKGGIFNSKMNYKPALIIVGKSQAVPGLEEALVGMDVGQEKETDVPATKGFGERNPNLINVMPLARFQSERIDPVPGMIVSLDNKDATIRSVSGGRVVVDFNHPLAGQQLKYKLKVLAVLVTPEERVKALFDESDMDGTASLDGGVVMLKVKADSSYNFLVKKQSLVNWLVEMVPEIKSVKVNEEYEITEGKAGRSVKALENQESA